MIDVMNPGQTLAQFNLRSGESATIRVAQISDAQMICDMKDDHSSERGPITESEKADLAQVTSWLQKSITKLEKGEYVLCYAFLGDKIIGECSIERGIGTGDYLGELGISTVKSYRQQGVATALIDAAEKLAASVGINKVILQVYATNSAALDLYNKIGYVEYGRLPDGYQKRGEYFDKVLMYKDIVT